MVDIDTKHVYNSMLRKCRCEVCPVMCQCWNTKEECEEAIIEMRNIFKLCKQAKVYAHKLIIGGAFGGYEIWCETYKKKHMKGYVK